ncbi:UNVERIFIED_CONTAM: hypothetical protein GTU68_010495 [Idotea baltica]|nr:hypothetical protein [Idotea baltica]
MEYLTPRH